MRKWVSVAASVAVIAGLIVPGASASAASPYDAATQSDLHNLYNAMANFYYYGPTGSFEGVTEQGLSDQGYVKPANSKVQLWIEGSGDNFAATSEDIRGGQQYSVTASGYFQGNGAGSVGASYPQPPAQALVATYLIADTNVALDAEALATALVAGKVTGQALCDATLEYPGTHSAGSSLSDQSLACYSALQASGSTVNSIVIALRTASGAAMLGFIGYDFIGDGSRPATTPSWVGTNQPRPTTARAVTPTLPDFWSIPKTAPQLSGDAAPAAKQNIMTQCLQRIAIVLAGDPVTDCQNTPIFASGQSDVKEATNHDIEALLQTPQWVVLHYRASGENPSYEGWQNSDPVCTAKATGQNCDEYPFYSSQEGGGNAVPRPSLKAIDGPENQLQGRNYSSFLAACHLYTSDDKTFLAIPVPPAFPQLGTLAICNGH